MFRKRTPQAFEIMVDFTRTTDRDHALERLHRYDQEYAITALIGEIRSLGTQTLTFLVDADTIPEAQRHGREILRSSGALRPRVEHDLSHVTPIYDLEAYDLETHHQTP